MISYDKVSKPGSRPVNEDYAAGIKYGNYYLFVLCDGLGGHGSGDVASRTAGEAFINEFVHYDGNIKKYYSAAYQRAQQNIAELQKTNESMSMMKTTLVSLIIDSGRASWTHIGDSRLYYFKNGELVMRTADHSVPQMLYKSGEITEREIRFHPDRNKLLRALGDMSKEPQYTDSDFVPVEDQCAFLLCSDGFWEYITEGAMADRLKSSENAAEWMSMMTEEVEKNNSGKKSDNYTAIAVIINEDGKL